MTCPQVRMTCDSPSSSAPLLRRPTSKRTRIRKAGLPKTAGVVRAAPAAARKGPTVVPRLTTRCRGRTMRYCPSRATMRLRRSALALRNCRCPYRWSSIWWWAAKALLGERTLAFQGWLLGQRWSIGGFLWSIKHFKIKTFLKSHKAKKLKFFSVFHT